MVDNKNTEELQSWSQVMGREVECAKHFVRADSRGS